MWHMMPWIVYSLTLCCMLIEWMVVVSIKCLFSILCCPRFNVLYYYIVSTPSYHRKALVGHHHYEDECKSFFLYDIALHACGENGKIWNKRNFVNCRYTQKWNVFLVPVSLFSSCIFIEFNYSFADRSNFITWWCIIVKDSHWKNL